MHTKRDICDITVDPDILAGKTISEPCCLLQGRWVDGGTIAPPMDDTN